MGWNVLNYIFGAISILGPILLIFWYIKAVRVRMSDFNKKKED